MALLASAGKWRLLHGNTHQVPALNNSGGDLTAGTAVHYTSGAMAAAGDANTVGVHGVLADDVADGEIGTLQANGVFEVGVNGTIDFAIDDPVYTHTSGLVNEGSTNDVEVGRIASEENPANGAATVKIEMRSLFTTTDLLTHA